MAGHPSRLNSWRGVRDEIRRRIDARVWSPGEAIPNEAEIAEEFDCARSTVNRALRELAEQGLVTRRRRAGTRVTLNPPARAMLKIPILREEVEAKGMTHRHKVLERRIEAPPSLIRHRLDIDETARTVRIVTLHLAEGRPYALDQRWINLATAPEAANHDFDAVSPNEWLVQNSPYTHGDFCFSAEKALEIEREHLGACEDDALLILERSTWRHEQFVTTTRVSFPAGYRICADI